MRGFSRFIACAAVLIVAAAAAFAMANHGGFLIDMHPATEVLTQNSQPVVSVYSGDGSETHEVTLRIDNNDADAPNTDGGRTPSELSVTEYRGKRLDKKEAMTFQPTANYVKPIGRTVFDDGKRYMSMSGSGVEFDCEGEWADIQLINEKAAYTTGTHQPRTAVYVNGMLVFDSRLTDKETMIHIDLTSCGGRAVVRVMKLSESMYSYIAVGDITVFGDRPIVPTAEKKLKIEFIGDSITSGFGIDEPNRNGGFSTGTENFSKTYAYLASCELGADYSAVSYAGYGVLSGFSNGGTKSNAVIFGKYGNALDGKAFSEESGKGEWSFIEFMPNLVVINLGTNDASYCKTYERRMEFVKEYRRLIELVREKNPDAYILCVLGDMNNSMYPYIEQALYEYVGQTGDDRVECGTISFNIAQNGAVITGHPNENSNRSAAYELANKIREIDGCGLIY